MTTKTLAAIVVATVSSVVFLTLTAGALLAAGGPGLCGTAIVRLPSPATPTDARQVAVTRAPAAASATTAPPAASPSNIAGGCGDGGSVLGRAATWLTAWHGGPVPYSMSTNPATWLDGYRRDCSGYASMALGLPGPGLDTTALAAGSVPIQKTDLRPGDLLINSAPGSAGHLVIFDHWVDASKTSYLGFEQAGDGGTHHRVIPYPYFGGYPMNPYRHATQATTTGTITTPPKPAPA
jgi:hypothetical protein